ncbi:MAG: flavodoxin family protein [Deltaproteobacteria bacterium]|jgi:multimeric flavodoxin WrbA|nr:flavodoxin family protein [Deltaproteobacteria bacterium]
MKIVTILGSPRKKGNTAKILELFENNVVSQGHEIDRINITSYNLKGCLACDKCKKIVDAPGCIQKDDMLSLFDRMISADAIVYATPLYWWGFTAQLKTLIDRQYCLSKNDDTLEFKSFLKGKPEALLVTCADSIENNADLIPVMFQRKCDYTASIAIGKYILPSCTSPDEMGEDANKIAEKMAQDILGTQL